MYLLASFFLQNFKKTPIQIYEDVSSSGPKWPICEELNFFGKNHYYYFHVPIDPFHCVKILKSSYSESRVLRRHHFCAQNRTFVPNKIFSFFFIKNINIIFIYLLVPFILQNFLKILKDNLEL